LFEPQATNLSYGILNHTAAAGTLVSSGLSSEGLQFGLYTATGSGVHQLYPFISVGSSGTYTYWCIVKNSGIAAFLQLMDDSGAVPYIRIDLTTGTIVTSGGATGVVRTLATGEWFISMTFTAGATISPRIRLLDASQNTSYTAAGEAVLIAQPQIELGSVATSPIITAGSAVTRLADNFLLQNMQTNGIANGLSFTIILDIYYTKSDILLDPLNFAGDQRIGIISIISGIASCINAFGQVGTTSVNTGASIGDRVKIAVVNNNNTLTIFANGVKASTSATTTAGNISTLRDGMGNVEIGYLSNGLYFYPASLSDSECIELTTI
jgi:hypothetical protein